MNMPDKSDPRLPDFLLGGTVKGGTTTLYNILKKHPDITMSRDKELHFFNRDDPLVHPETVVRGSEKLLEFSLENEDIWEQYLKNFSRDETLKGEATSTYMHSRRAARRAQQYLDNPKAIFALRDPVERAQSHYWHDIIRGRAFRSFSGAIVNTNRYRRYSIYPPSIRRWEEQLGKENVKILLLEELIDQPRQTLEDLFSFLEVEEINLEEIPQKNEGRYPRFPRINRLVNLYLNLREKEGLQECVKFRSGEIFSPLEKFLRRTLVTNNLMETETKPEMDKEMRNKLENMFRKENREILEIHPSAEEHWSIF